MIPKDKVEQAQCWAKGEIFALYGHKDVMNNTSKEMLSVLIELAKSHLQASDELPCEKEEYGYTDDGRKHEIIENIIHNECLSIVKPIVARNYVKRSEVEKFLDECDDNYDGQIDVFLYIKEKLSNSDIIKGE